MRVKLHPTHRFQSIRFFGMEVNKETEREIPPEAEGAALNDARLICVLPVEDPKPAPKRRGKE
jgi:hypothetical protein